MRKAIDYRLTQSIQWDLGYFLSLHFLSIYNDLPPYIANDISHGIANQPEHISFSPCNIKKCRLMFCRKNCQLQNIRVPL